MDDAMYKKLSASIDGELMIDTFYSVEAADMDGDGCEELVCRQYAWGECHAEHIGDIVSTIKMNADRIIISDLRIEPSV